MKRWQAWLGSLTSLLGALAIGAYAALAWVVTASTGTIGGEQRTFFIALFAAAIAGVGGAIALFVVGLRRVR